LFEALSLPVDVRCEDAFRHTFPDHSFDVVYSCGLIEHFDDPRALVAKHAALLAPGGVALIAVPNYGGVFGRIQARFHPENLTVHNLAIMTPQAMAQLAPPDPDVTARAYRFGRLSPGLVTWRAALPGPLARLVWHALNVAGMLQPFDIPALAPHLVLELRRA
jgi:SAM-dependent methyltransferase